MKKKQVLSMGLAASLALCLAAPAVQAEETEGVTLTIAVGQHSSDVVEDFNEKYAIKEACEATGINVEWIPILEGDAGTEQVAVRLAGDMPDVFIGLMTDTLITDNASLFVPLEDMIEEYCPNIYATYTESVDGWEDYLTYPDGHIYSLMGNYMASYNNFINGTMWINQTWLDNCGLEMPTTMEELEQVLIAFRDMDADGDGDTEDEIPMDFCQKHYAARYYELAHCLHIATI